jgi:hypothetical protein
MDRDESEPRQKNFRNLVLEGKSAWKHVRRNILPEQLVGGESVE